MNVTTLDDINGKLDEVLRLLRATAPKPVASDADLDGQWGDPVVKMKDPRDWTGETMVGKRLSECPADYLELLASRSDYFAEKNDADGTKDDKGRPKSHWDRKAAALARGWAKRNRTNPKPSPSRDEDPFA